MNEHTLHGETHGDTAKEAEERAHARAHAYFGGNPYVLDLDSHEVVTLGGEVITHLVRYTARRPYPNERSR